jgi:hypothetical protein
MMTRKAPALTPGPFFMKNVSLTPSPLPEGEGMLEGCRDLIYDTSLPRGCWKVALMLIYNTSLPHPEQTPPRPPGEGWGEGDADLLKTCYLAVTR